MLTEVYILIVTTFGAIYFERNVGGVNDYAWYLAKMLLPLIIAYIILRQALLRHKTVFGYIRISFGYIGACYTIVSIYGTVVYLMDKTGIDYTSAIGYLLVFPVTNKIFDRFLKSPERETEYTTN